MKFLLGEHTNPAYNLAMEEYVLSNCRDDDYFILWVNDPSIIIGKYQNVYQEVDVPSAFRQQIPIYRRNSGGGCVYHDKGNLNFSFITDWRIEENTYSRFLNPILDVLRKYHIPAHQTGICNLSINDRKISGNAQAIMKKRILHHGTLLFDTDLNRIKNVIRPEYDHYISNAMHSVKMPVTNIREYKGCEIRDMGELKRYLLEELGYRPEYKVHISGEGHKEIEKIREKKYCSWEWNYASGANFEYCRYMYNPRGIIRYKVEKGILTELFVEHEQLLESECRILTEMLKQKHFHYPEMHDMLEPFGTGGALMENLLFCAD